jgi:hypothetical protein
MTTLPTSDPDSIRAWMASHGLGHGAGAGTILAAYRQDLTALLEQAAAGRREYAANAPQDSADVLEQEACTLDGVARLATGDPASMTCWLPSWRWMDEMNRAATGTPAVRHVDGCACLESDGAVLNVDLRCDIP